MSIRHSLLALLSEGPRYGYQLRGDFESRTGSTWPLNIGQVYTTLDRLERDGLVVNDGDDGAGHVIYRLSEAGRAEADGWFATPVVNQNPPRNELAIKLALALTLDGVDVSAIIQTQRAASITTLQDFTRQRRSAAAELDAPENGTDGTAWLLVLDALIFETEAEIRWLDHCEGWLAKRAQASAGTATRSPANGSPATGSEATHEDARAERVAK
ncbi:DNA-binding PadR family transcriptional regulator [Mycetocola sp. BIGb0189]|uniref:PadR family transcriptional regulator n=1 Tax=Mycetocola sp. BIGb0189 TaxID=2940604 RepID=UPI002166F399|nr:PadR family transcriptional regulator [Mycetocola sp. BIGb0189]MCS4276189.1 DNA-binding PadR family transcriptional regulator [Mycetocola sp. BIGb0189]